MLIDIIQYSAQSNYIPNPTDHNCHICNHPQGICSGSCEECLSQIHWNKAEAHPGYDCSNMINYYICKFLGKYTSEIYYLSKKSGVIANLQEYSILSLGCGALPDLCAFEQLSFMNNNKRISYYGIDLNNLWIPYWNMTQNYCVGNPMFGEIGIVDQDAITGLTNLSPLIKPNILVIEYLVSSILSAGQNSYLKYLFNILVDFIISRQLYPLAILFTDFNHTNNTNYFNSFLTSLNQSLQTNLISSCYHFTGGVKSSYQNYGESHDNGAVLRYFIPQFDISFCNPWTYCTAAQMIIERS